MSNIKIPYYYEDENNTLYDRLREDIVQSIGEGEINRLLSWEYCELDYEYLGFLENYHDLKNIPLDYAIIDFGCYQAIQADYFKDHIAYIGVEPTIPKEYRLKQDNALYYEQTIKEFIDDTLPKLIDIGFDKNKIIAICSAVPDFKETAIVSEVFPYHRIAYPSTQTIESLPDIPAPEKIITKSNDYDMER